MNKYLCSFNGRLVGAIGAFQGFQKIRVEAETREKARLKLYDTHEHISGIFMEKVNSELPAFRVFLSDGSNYVTSMASGTTIGQAERYFMGQVQVTEDMLTGKETRLTVTKVEAV